MKSSAYPLYINYPFYLPEILSTLPLPFFYDFSKIPHY